MSKINISFDELLRQDRIHKDKIAMRDLEYEQDSAISSAKDQSIPGKLDKIIDLLESILTSSRRIESDMPTYEQMKYK